jgi:hypothetical protein
MIISAVMGLFVVEEVSFSDSIISINEIKE